MEPGSQTQKTLVLIIDDEPAFRRLLGGRLAKLGYEVIYANDGNEGRETARRLQPDLILLDYRMPVMDGMAAASLMKKEAPTKDIPIMMLTNEDLSLEAQEALRAVGVSAYVQKGADFAVLAERMKAVLRRA